MSLHGGVPYYLKTKLLNVFDFIHEECFLFHRNDSLIHELQCVSQVHVHVNDMCYLIPRGVCFVFFSFNRKII